MAEVETEERVFAYRGLCAHGKVRAICTDPSTPRCADYAGDLRKEVAKMFRTFASVDRVPIEDARKSEIDCSVCDDKRLNRKRVAGEK